MQLYNSNRGSESRQITSWRGFCLNYQLFAPIGDHSKEHGSVKWSKDSEKFKFSYSSSKFKFRDSILFNPKFKITH